MSDTPLQPPPDPNQYRLWEGIKAPLYKWAYEVYRRITNLLNTVVYLTDVQTVANKTLTNPVVDGTKLILDYDIDLKLGSAVTNDFGWDDLLGRLQIRTAGANDPTWAVYQGNIRQFQFSNAGMREVWLEFHINHDFAKGTDLHLHVHWSCAVAHTGNVKWSFDIMYAKGHNQAAFPAEITTSVTQASSGTAFRHMLAETVITDNGASLIDRSLIEPDGLLLVRLWRDPADAADTLNQAPFVHYCDIHFQRARFATKNKAPDFYA